MDGSLGRLETAALCIASSPFDIGVVVVENGCGTWRAQCRFAYCPRSLPCLYGPGSEQRPIPYLLFKREWHLIGPDRYDGSLATADMEAFLRVVDDGRGELCLRRRLKQMYELPPEVRPISWMVEVAHTEGGFGNRMARGVVHFSQLRPARKTPWVASRHKAEQDLNRLLFAEGVLSSAHRPMLLTLTSSAVTHRGGCMIVWNESSEVPALGVIEEAEETTSEAAIDESSDSEAVSCYINTE